MFIRGGVIIKKQENFGQCPKDGGVSEKKILKSKFGHLKTQGGLNFSKQSDKLLLDPILKKKNENT